MEKKETDPFRTVFDRMVEEEALPDGFQARMMQRIMQERERVRRRSERLQMLLILAALAAIAGLAASSFIYLKISLPIAVFPALSIPVPCLLTGALALLLLAADYFMRQAYYKKHPF
ncbi:MAG: hypothetical protein LBK07_03390 [Tannerella sp.]|jgi:hypothetical protein|nr:hypothetical protein [Tannerella sp.]